MSDNPPIYRAPATGCRKCKMPPPRRPAALSVPVREARMNYTPADWRHVTIVDHGGVFEVMHAVTMLPITSHTRQLIGAPGLDWRLYALPLCEAIAKGTLLERLFKEYRER